MISIRWTLPLFIVTPLVAGIGLTGWIAFRNGQSAVELLVQNLSAEVASKIEKEVVNYLSRPSVISETVIAEIENGNIELTDVEKLGKDFWYLTRSPVLTNNLFYGNEKGEFIYTARENDNNQMSFVNASTQFLRVTYEVTESGTLGKQLSKIAYDPRGRKWYQKAVQNQKAIWSDVYIAKSRPELTLTRAIPIFQRGQLKGVLGIDVYLTELSDFLRKLDISASSRAFIIDPSGQLIATSSSEPPFLKDAKNELLQRSALHSQDRLVKATIENLIANAGNLSQLDSQYTFDFDLDNKKQLAHAYRLQDLGVDWLIVVAIPQDRYMGTINASARQTMILGFGISGITSLLGLAVALWIVRPIQRINQAAQDIKANRFEESALKPVISRPDEFGQLAELFNDMAIVVVSREQSLADQVEALRSEIDQYGNLGANSLDKPVDLKALLRHSQHLRQTLNNQRTSA